MGYDKTYLVRQLIPTKYHFDAYNLVNCPNSRDKPFFSNNVIQFDDEHYLTIQLVNKDKISLTFSSVCEHGEITFLPYYITLDNFISKLKQAVQSGSDYIPIELTVHYCTYSKCKSCNFENASCKNLKKNRFKKVYAAVSFNFNEMKEALAMYFEITNKNFNGGIDTMKNNRKNKFFGMNFEFGLSKDPNIASTLMGLAVRNPQNGNWYVFDAANKTIKNLANIKVGSFPVVLVPVKEYVVGHLYKINNQYYYVQSINADKSVAFISATDGTIVNRIPEAGLIPGMNFHTEVIAFDANTLSTAGSSTNIGGNLLAAMLMMGWSKGDSAEFSIDSINDDSFNGLGSFLPILLANNGGNGSNLFTNSDGSLNWVTLMAMGAGDSSECDGMQMLILSNLLNGGSLSSLTPGLAPATAPTPSEDTVVCEKCNATYPADTNFCPKCGGKTKIMAAKTCRKCNTPLKDGALFCHNCGAKASLDVCHKCGHHIDDDANFCPKCGTNLKVAEAAEEVLPVASATAKS